MMAQGSDDDENCLWFGRVLVRIDCGPQRREAVEEALNRGVEVGTLILEVWREGIRVKLYERLIVDFQAVLVEHCSFFDGSGRAELPE